MSDISEVAPATETVVCSQPAAPLPNGNAGDTQGSVPASEDTSANGQAVQTEGDESPEQKQTRRDSRAFASLRRENRDLQRMLGRLEERIGAVSRPSTEGQPEQPGNGQGDASEVERRIRQEFAQRDTERTSRTFWSSTAKEAKDKGIDGFTDARDAIQSGEIPSNPAMSHYLTEMADNKAALVVWLADNPEEAERIASLDPVSAGAALAKADARISAKPAPRTTKAPPPVPTVGGRSAPNFDPDKASMDEYAAHWKARNAKG